MYKLSPNFPQVHITPQPRPDSICMCKESFASTAAAATPLAVPPVSTRTFTNARLLSSVTLEGTGVMERSGLRRQPSSALEWEMLLPIFNEEDSGLVYGQSGT